MEIFWMIIVGFVIGLLGRLFKPGDDDMGFIFTTIIGMVGAVVGGYLGRILGMYEANEPVGFVMAIIGAIITLTVVQLIRRRSIHHH